LRLPGGLPLRVFRKLTIINKSILVKYFIIKRIKAAIPKNSNHPEKLDKLNKPKESDIKGNNLFTTPAKNTAQCKTTFMGNKKSNLVHNSSRLS